MLNILTPVSRINFLSNIYKTIPHSEDIRWWLAVNKQRSSEVRMKLPDDKRIIVIEIDCEETDIVAKRNALFNRIDNGFFCLLDDDTIFKKEMYQAFINCEKEGYEGVLIGSQTIGRFCLRTPLIPSPNYDENLLDTGMILAHFSILKLGIRWEYPNNRFSDRIFFTRIGENSRAIQVIMDHSVISYYNYFEYKFKVYLTFLGKHKAYYFYNSFLVLLFFTYYKIKHKNRNNHFSNIKVMVNNGIS